MLILPFLNSVCEAKAISYYLLNLQFRISQCQFWLNVLISDKGEETYLKFCWNENPPLIQGRFLGGWGSTPVRKGQKCTSTNIVSLLSPILNVTVIHRWNLNLLTLIQIFASIIVCNMIISNQWVTIFNIEHFDLNGFMEMWWWSMHQKVIFA